MAALRQLVEDTLRAKLSVPLLAASSLLSPSAAAAGMPAGSAGGSHHHQPDSQTTPHIPTTARESGSGGMGSRGGWDREGEQPSMCGAVPLSPSRHLKDPLQLYPPGHVVLLKREGAGVAR